MDQITNAAAPSIPIQVGYKSIAKDFLDDGYDAAYRIGKSGLTATVYGLGACIIPILSAGVPAWRFGCAAGRELFQGLKAVGALAYAPIKGGARGAAHTYSVITPNSIQNPLNAASDHLGRTLKAVINSKSVEILCSSPSKCWNAGISSKPVQFAIVKPAEAVYSYVGGVCRKIGTNVLETAAANVLPTSFQGKSDSIARKQKHDSYPDRQEVKDHQVSWSVPFSKYSPPYFDAPSVLEEERKVGEELMELYAEMKNEMPGQDLQFTLEDFLTPGNRQISSSCLGAIVLEDGKPLNPRGRTGLAGRGVLPDWGPNYLSTALLTRINSESGKLEALFIKNENGEYTLPTGLQKINESLNKTASRILEEEFGIQLPCKKIVLLTSEYVEDCRNTDNAWIEQRQVQVHVSFANANQCNSLQSEKYVWADVSEVENGSENLENALAAVQVPIWM